MSTLTVAQACLSNYSGLPLLDCLLPTAASSPEELRVFFMSPLMWVSPMLQLMDLSFPRFWFCKSLIAQAPENNHHRFDSRSHPYFHMHVYACVYIEEKKV